MYDIPTAKVVVDPRAGRLAKKKAKNVIRSKNERKAEAKERKRGKGR